MSTPASGDMSGPPTRGRPVYRRAHRLRHALEFRAVYGSRHRASKGPLTVLAIPNGLDRPRLGLSVGRRAGGAVRRNAIKRRLRDAFRHVAAAWPQARPMLDVVITVRAHEPLRAGRYQAMLEAALLSLARRLEPPSDPVGEGSGERAEP